MITGYLAKEGFEDLLITEIKNPQQQYGRLILSEGPVQDVLFAQNIWYDVEMLSFSSIAHAAKLLRERGALWALYPTICASRARLIQEKLPYFSPKAIVFPSTIPKGSLGSWTLISDNIMLAASRTASSLAHGQPIFVESKLPPSRAYLKLWEALFLEGVTTLKGKYCLDIGAAPGSWTWALQGLGANVYAVDRASLDVSIQGLEGVTAVKKDAFALQPKDFQEMDWIFSDVICYPEKLLHWIQDFISIKPSIKCVCTLKFQGDKGYDVVKQFLQIPYSKVRYLFYNKHELCWIYNPT